MRFHRIGNSAAVFVASAVLGCSKPPPTPSPITPALAARSTVPSPDAEACAGCHPAEVAAWRTSQHALANRLVNPRDDGDATPPGRNVRAEAVIGITPLIQYLAPFPGGRLQVVDIARDTRSNEWFFAFNDQRRPHEWGYWTNRAMNWNSQCAACHMTEFRKNYDPATDTYASTWKAMGISCAQCHVLRDQKSEVSGPCPMVLPSNLASRISYLDSCASCHSRREELTGRFSIGDAFHDQFRLMLANATQFHPDGQVNDENFEYASFAMSRMAHRGVVCLDCHDPHSGKLRQPVENNVLCLQCHIPPGLRNATPIDPVGHSGHAPANSGSLCVECHMPHNAYMVRDRRRDHGMTSPDPLLTKELGIPNACTRCHPSQPVEWAIQWTDQWYGTNMERRARARARVVAAARGGDAGVVSNLLRLAATEEIDAWRAALVELLQAWSHRPDVRDTLVKSLRDTNALVRSAAIHGLQGTPGAHELIAPLRKDPARLVRIDAARATLNELEREPISYAELNAYLNATCDQPAGALRMAQFHLAEGRTADAESWARKATAWDPTSGATHSSLGQLLHQAGKAPEAEASLREACRVEPNQAAHPYTLALLLAEEGRTQEAILLLEQAVALDAAFGRAWYNLGLAQAGLGQFSNAVVSLQHAERLTPDSPEPAYALATVYAQMQQPDPARAAAGRALTIAPNYPPAQRLINLLPPEAAP